MLYTIELESKYLLCLLISMSSSILVTGGLGFIGSHTLVELLNSQSFDNIIVVDNLSNSKITVLEKIKELTNKSVTFLQLDILNVEDLKALFASCHITSVIHFAALKSVGESIQQPAEYYETNVMGTIQLVRMMREHKCHNLIFSSSATVYGEQEYPVHEASQTGVGLTNPYGRTKYMVEEILKDYAAAYPEMNITLLRYFNPVGAHPSGLIGEDPNGIPNNLCPYVLRVARGIIPQLTVYGKDYPTHDGTCIRDFIHVVDLAKAHLAALQAMENSKIKGLSIYNVGTGNGVTVLDFLTTFENVNHVALSYQFGDRRKGDLPIVYSNADKIYQELGWKAEKTLYDICRDAYHFVKK
jgi:UDP-glucose 4-epimerase